MVLTNIQFRHLYNDGVAHAVFGFFKNMSD